MIILFLLLFYCSVGHGALTVGDVCGSQGACTAYPTRECGGNLACEYSRTEPCGFVYTCKMYSAAPTFAPTILTRENAGDICLVTGTCGAMQADCSGTDQCEFFERLGCGDIHRCVKHPELDLIPFSTEITEMHSFTASSPVVVTLEGAAFGFSDGGNVRVYQYFDEAWEFSFLVQTSMSTITSLHFSESVVITSSTEGAGAVTVHSRNTTPRPTTSPTTAAPTPSPTFDKTLAYLEIIPYIYEEASAGFVPMAEQEFDLIRFTRPEVYHFDIALNVTEAEFDDTGRFTGLVSLAEMQFTHIAFDFTVTKPANLVLADQVMFTINIFADSTRTKLLYSAPQRHSFPIVAENCALYSSNGPGFCGPGDQGPKGGDLEFCMEPYDWNGSPFDEAYLSSIQTVFAKRYRRLKVLPGADNVGFCYAYVGGTSDVFIKTPRSGTTLTKSVRVFFDDTNMPYSGAAVNIPSDKYAQPVTVTLTNWQSDDIAMVLGQVQAFERYGNALLHTFTPSEIELVAGSRSEVDAKRYYCASNLFEYTQGYCVSTLREYTNQTESVCIGDTLSVSLGGDSEPECLETCHLHPACVGVSFDSLRSSCILYRSILGNDVQAGTTCYTATFPFTVKEGLLPLGVFVNQMTDFFPSCNAPLYAQIGTGAVCAYKNPSASLCYNEGGKTPTDKRVPCTYTVPGLKTARVLSKARFTLPPNVGVLQVDMGDTKYDSDGLHYHSSASYVVEQAGAVIASGLLSAPRTHIHLSLLVEQSNLRKNYRKFDDMRNLRLYGALCKEDSSGRLLEYSSHYRAMMRGVAVDLDEFCDGAYGDLNGGDIISFEAKISAIQLSLQEQYAVLGFDGTPNAFVRFESNFPDIKHTQESFKEVVLFLDIIGRRVECKDYASGGNGVFYNAGAVANELFYQYSYPGAYTARCTKDQMGRYSYFGNEYKRGLSEAPCVANAMCAAGHVCVGWRCIRTGETGAAKTMCIAESESVRQPDYSVLQPQNKTQKKCSKEPVYSNAGEYDYTLSDNGVSLVDNYNQPLGGNCLKSGEVHRQAFGPKHFADRGNQQECSTAGSSEMFEEGPSFKMPLYGFISQTGDPFSMDPSLRCPITESASRWSGFRGWVNRLVPHKIPSSFLTVTEQDPSGISHKTMPSEFGVDQDEYFESRLESIDFYCQSSSNRALTGPFGGSEIQMKEACLENPACDWHKALRQCVAGKIEVRRLMCTSFQSYDQCELSGFCYWYHTANVCLIEGEAESSTVDFTEAFCPTLLTVTECSLKKCYWDVVFENCVSKQIKTTSGDVLHNLTAMTRLNLLPSDHIIGMSTRLLYRSCLDAGGVIYRYANGAFNHETEARAGTLEICMRKEQLWTETECNLYSFRWMWSATKGWYCMGSDPVSLERSNAYGLLPVWDGYPCDKNLFSDACVAATSGGLDLKWWLSNPGVRKLYGYVEVRRPTCRAYGSRLTCLNAAYCEWMLAAHVCVAFNSKSGAGSDHRKLSAALFDMPAYDTTADILRNYNTSFPQYNWDWHFRGFGDQVADELVIENVLADLEMCPFDNYLDCAFTSVCYWDMDLSECVAHECQALTHAYGTRVVRETPGVHDNKEGAAVRAFSNPCGRLAGCHRDPQTDLCFYDSPPNESARLAEDGFACTAMSEKHRGLCNYHLAGREHVCVVQGTFCEARYLYINSVELDTAVQLIVRQSFQQDYLTPYQEFHRTWSTSPTTAQQIFEAGIVTFQFLSAGERTMLEADRFMAPPADLLTLFGGLYTDYEVNVMVYERGAPFGPEVFASRDPTIIRIARLGNIRAYVIDGRPQQDFRVDKITAMTHEALDVYRRSNLHISSFAMHGGSVTTEVTIRIEERFLAEYDLYPLLDREFTSALILALAEMTSTEQAIRFLRSLSLEEVKTFEYEDTQSDVGVLQNLIRSSLNRNSLDLVRAMADNDGKRLTDMTPPPLNYNPQEVDLWRPAVLVFSGAFAVLSVMGKARNVEVYMETIQTVMTVSPPVIPPVIPGGIPMVFEEYVDELVEIQALQFTEWAEDNIELDMRKEMAQAIDQAPERALVARIADITTESTTVEYLEKTQATTAKQPPLKKKNRIPQFMLPKRPVALSKNPYIERMEAKYKDGPSDWRGAGDASSDSLKVHIDQQDPDLLRRIEGRQQMTKYIDQRATEMAAPPPTPAPPKVDPPPKAQMAMVEVKTGNRLAAQIDSVGKLTKSFSLIGRVDTITSIAGFIMNPADPKAIVEVTTEVGPFVVKGLNKLPFFQKSIFAANKVISVAISRYVPGLAARFSAFIVQTNTFLATLGGSAILGPLMAAATVLQIGMMISDVFAAYDLARKKDPGCRYSEGNTYFYTEMQAAFGETDVYTAENICSQRASYALFDSLGTMGFIDARAAIPICSNDVDSSNMDTYFSEPDAGLNTICSTKSDCKLFSAVGRCISGRCVFPVGYVGHQLCTEQVLPQTRPFEILKGSFLGSTRRISPDMGLQFFRPDPLLDGQKAIEACNFTKFAVITSVGNWQTSTNKVVCFDTCTKWEKSTDSGKHTFMMKMDERTMQQDPVVCTSSQTCPQGQICTSGGYCHGPIECDANVDCFGTFYREGRRPLCDTDARTCVDNETITDDCGDSVNNDCYTYPPTGIVFTPTVSPTSKPTVTPPPPECVSGLGDSSLMTNFMRPPDFADLDDFGRTISMDGAFAVVGAPQKGSGNGAAYVLKAEGNAWVHKATLPHGTSTAERFGSSLATSAPWVAVGTSLDIVYLFKFADDAWAYYTGFSGDTGFGSSAMAIHGDIMAIGAQQSTSMYRFSGVSWTKTLTIARGAVSLSVNGNTTALGDGNGKVYVYETINEGRNWVQVSEIAHADKSFGSAIALSGDTLLVGAPTADVPQCGFSDTGFVNVYARASGWAVMTQQLLAPASENFDAFGDALALDGLWAVVGAMGKSNFNGAAYLFTRDDINGLFTLDVGLRDSAGAYLAVGTAVAVRDGIVAVTSPVKAGSGVVYFAAAANAVKETQLPTSSPTNSPTRSPVTARPTNSPTDTSPLAGEQCSFTQHRGSRCFSQTNTTTWENPPGGWAACSLRCRDDPTCMAFTYNYGDDPDFCAFVTDPAVYPVGNLFSFCFTKDIPCVPTAAPTSPGVTPAPTPLPTRGPTLVDCYGDSIGSEPFTSWGDIIDSAEIPGTATSTQADWGDREYTAKTMCDANPACTFTRATWVRFGNDLIDLYGDILTDSQVVVLGPTEFKRLYKKMDTCKQTSSPTTPTKSPTKPEKLCQFDVLVGREATGYEDPRYPQAIRGNAEVCVDLCTVSDTCAGVASSAGECRFYGRVTDLSAAPDSTAFIKNDPACTVFEVPTRKPTKSPTRKPTVFPTASPTRSPQIFQNFTGTAGTQPPTIPDTDCQYNIRADTHCPGSDLIDMDTTGTLSTQGCVTLCDDNPLCRYLVIHGTKCFLYSNTDGDQPLTGITCYEKMTGCNVPWAPTGAPTSAAPSETPSAAPTWAPTNPLCFDFIADSLVDIPYITLVVPPDRERSPGKTAYALALCLNNHTCTFVRVSETGPIDLYDVVMPLTRNETGFATYKKNETCLPQPTSTPTSAPTSAPTNTQEEPHTKDFRWWLMLSIYVTIPIIVIGAQLCGAQISSPSDQTMFQ